MSSIARQLFGHVSKIFSPGTLVGMDKLGNKFYTRMDIVNGLENERRFFKPPKHVDPEDFDHTSISVEWHSWLGKNRDDPPTPEESERLEQYRESVRLKVAELAAEEAKRKVRARALKPQDASAPDMGMLHLQMGDEQGRVREADDPTQHNSMPSSGKQTSSSEPTGTGDTFSPGTWQPGK